MSLHPRERTIRGRMTSGHPASARAAPWYVPSRTFSPRQRLRLAAGGRHAKWHCVHASTRARASTPLATVALKSKRQGARVVRRLAVVWVGVGGRWQARQMALRARIHTRTRKHASLDDGTQKQEAGRTRRPQAGRSVGRCRRSLRRRPRAPR